MLPGTKHTPEDFARILRRRWWLVVPTLLLGAAAGAIGYKQMPIQYRSETVIMVIPQRIPDSYVKATVTTNVEDRLRSIEEQIHSRSRLEKIVRDFDLYKAERAASRSLEDVVQRMRSDIEVKLQDNGASFQVSYVNRDARTAQRVTERLAALSIEENLRDRESVADSTNTLLESQLDDAKQRLIEQEKKLERYRRGHAGQLPSQLQTNLQTVQSAQTQLQSLAESMNRARERRLLVERQLADVQAAPVELVLPGATESPEAVARWPVTQQLQAARSRLDQLKLRYTADHPDVRKAEEAVRRLQARVSEEARGATPDQMLSPAEVANRRRLHDLEAERDVIDHQLAASQAEEGRLKRTIADYQAKIDIVPTRESELVELTRDYTTLQETYSTLLQKKEDSKLAANLERRRIGEQFRVLDPASLPDLPYNQKQRLAVLLGGPIGGLVLGLLIVAFVEYRDSTFKSEDDVVRVLALPVLALIPVMDGEGHSPRRRPPGRQ